MEPTCTAFLDRARIASGSLTQVAAAAKQKWDLDPGTPILIFDDITSEPVELDFRGTVDDVLRRIAPQPVAIESRRPGRPKLGVVAREVTLLPRHWEWLAAQPGGASVALRKLVDRARAEYQGTDRRRLAQESVYRFAVAMAGNEPGFEEAIRALFATDRARFHKMAQGWPPDIRDHAFKLAEPVFTE